MQYIAALLLIPSTSILIGYLGVSAFEAAEAVWSRTMYCA